MFGIGKEKNKQAPKKSKPEADSTTLLTAELDPKVADRVHTMPERFYVVEKQRHWGLVLIITLGLLVIGGLGTFAYLLNQSLEESLQTPPQETTPTNSNQSANTNTVDRNGNVNQNQPSNSNTNVSIPPANTNAPTATSTNTNTAGNLNANTNAPPPINGNANLNTNANTNSGSAPQPLPKAPDVDGDSLSLAEEALYGTDSGVADSDGDSFADGSEVLNGFDPSKPRLTLTETGAFKTYTHARYSIAYPGSWTVQPGGGQNEEVIFRSSGAEFMEVLILEKPSNQSIQEWYAQQFPDLDSREGRTQLNGLDGYKYPDNQSYYLVAQNDPTQIYWLSYNTGGLSQANYLTTFVAMVKVFSLR